MADFVVNYPENTKGDRLTENAVSQLLPLIFQIQTQQGQIMQGQAELKGKVDNLTVAIIGDENDAGLKKRVALLESASTATGGKIKGFKMAVAGAAAVASGVGSLFGWLYANSDKAHAAAQKIGGIPPMGGH